MAKDEDTNLDYEENDRKVKHESHQQRPDKKSDYSNTTEQDSTFGEAYGNDYGFGRHGEHEEPDAKDKEEGSEYASRFAPPEYTELSGPPRGYKEEQNTNWQPTDEALYTELWRMITEQSGIDYSDIDLVVDNREAFFSGSVDSEEDRQAIDDISNQVSGLEDVHNDLQLRNDAG